MVSEGALEGVDEVYGLHTWPGWPRGELRVAPGPLMAQVHSFEIRVTGKGGHGSQPQSCRDPIVAAAHLVTSLQTVVSRGVGSAGGAVVSVCAFNAGNTHNVVPEFARLQGTIRTFDEATTSVVLDRIREVTAGTAATFGVTVDFELEEGFPLLVNDPACVDAVERVAADAAAIDVISDGDLPMAGGEDFAYFAASRPSAYFFLGAGRPGEDTPTCHHPDFDFDDELLPVGIELFLRIVADRLSR
jgi:amidohydrolase